jgi:hypothetical protein
MADLAQRTNQTDVMSGLLRALADRGVASFTAAFGRVDAGFLAVYTKLKEMAPRYGLAVSFVVCPDMHGISDTCQEALGFAAYVHLVRSERYQYGLNVEFIQSVVDYASLPGDEALYRELADAFIGFLPGDPGLQAGEG